MNDPLRPMRPRRGAGRSWRMVIGCTLASAMHASFAGPTPRIPDPTRGALLYENQCIGCHTSVLHIREDRRSTSYEAMRDTVQHWAQVQHLEWTEQEIDDVGAFLDARYYHFGRPQHGDSR